MSRENVELLRRVNEAFNHGDFDEVLSFCGEDLQIEDLNNAPDVPRITYGTEEARRLFMAWTDAFGDLSAEIEEYIDADERRVGCLVHYRGTQRDTGLEVDFRGVDMWEVRDNKMIRAVLGYRDRESALEGVQQWNRAASRGGESL